MQHSFARQIAGEVAFAPPGSTQVHGDAAPPANLGEVLESLLSKPSPDRRLTEMKSALRKFGEAIRKPLSDIPAEPQALRDLMRTVVPAAAGLTKERWSRIRSLVSASLRDLGCDLQPGRDVCGHSPAWKALAASLPTRAGRHGLSRFMSFCTRKGLEPPDVTAATFEDFHKDLERRSLQLKPDTTWRMTVRHWNRGVDEVAGWPHRPIKISRAARYYSLEWDVFPPSLVQEVEAFLGHTGSEDEFSDDYVRAVRPATIRLRRRQLRQISSLLVLSGFPPERLTGLSVLVDIENAKAALKHHHTRSAGSTGVYLSQQAWLLKTIAQYWLRDSQNAQALAELAKRLGGRPKGMTARNRARLRQFDLRENKLALLRLPSKVFSEAARSSPEDIAAARRVMLALAVELLLVAPMRIRNLTSLDLDRHFVVIGRGRSRNRHVILPAAEMKTGEEFELILPASTVKLMDLYIASYRRTISASPSPLLFPTRDGRERNSTSFSLAVTKFVLRETGLKMHAHLFRQLAGKFHLDVHPCDLETVRLLLGHSSTTTTQRYYAENDTRRAYARYDDTLAQLRADSLRPARGGGRP